MCPSSVATAVNREFNAAQTEEFIQYVVTISVRHLLDRPEETLAESVEAVASSQWIRSAVKLVAGRNQMKTGRKIASARGRSVIWSIVVALGAACTSCAHAAGGEFLPREQDELREIREAHVEVGGDNGRGPSAAR